MPTSDEEQKLGLGPANFWSLLAEDVVWYGRAMSQENVRWRGGL